MKRILLLGLISACLVAVWLQRSPARVSASGAPVVSLNTGNAAPRQVEETTEKAVARDYAAAWQAMGTALEENRSDVLTPNFAGAAAEKLAATIEQQRKGGMRQHIVDRGHHVDVVFYSPEGSAMELHDTASLQLQLLDGSTVVHSEDVTIHYVVLLTAAENSWKVRVLEAVPAF